MTAINANMDNAQTWVPLADPESLAAGFYTLDSENIEVEGIHPTDPQREIFGGVGRVPNGRWAKRGVAGSVAASHTSGATLTRYYPDAPGGTDGGGVTLIGPFAVAWNTSGLETSQASLADLDDGTLVLGIEFFVDVAWNGGGPDVMRIGVGGADWDTPGNDPNDGEWVPLETFEADIPALQHGVEGSYRPGSGSGVVALRAVGPSKLVAWLDNGGPAATQGSGRVYALVATS